MNLRKTAEGFYGSARRLIAPRLVYSQSFYETVLKEHVGRTTVWLDLGCGHQILPDWRAEAESQLVKQCQAVIGLDYSLSSLKKHRNISSRIKGDITTLPFRDGSFDLVTANMVVEHLPDPSVHFREINRVLKPGGIFIFHTPNSLGHATLMARIIPGPLKDKLAYLFDGRKEEDVFETHYKANTRKQIIRLASGAGFEIIKITMLVSDALFAVVPPLAVLELIWIRALMTEALKRFRTTIISVLRKQTEREPAAVGSDFHKGTIAA